MQRVLYLELWEIPKGLRCILGECQKSTALNLDWGAGGQWYSEILQLKLSQFVSIGSSDLKIASASKAQLGSPTNDSVG